MSSLWKVATQLMGMLSKDGAPLPGSTCHVPPGLLPVLSARQGSPSSRHGACAEFGSAPRTWEAVAAKGARDRMSLGMFC